jgi:hypothetical protein
MSYVLCLIITTNARAGLTHEYINIPRVPQGLSPLPGTKGGTHSPAGEGDLIRTTGEKA